jgi:hypothetical protein
MRKLAKVAGVLFLLAAAPRVWGQTANTFSRVDPLHLTFTPVDTTKTLAAPVLAPQSSSFSLGNLFSKISLTNILSKPKIGTSPYPKPSSFPGFNRKSPLVPMAPFVPKN